MKSWLEKLHQNRYFILFIILFAYIQSISRRILSWQEINIYIFTPEAPLFSLIEVAILFFITRFYIKVWQKTEIASMGEMLKIFCLSLISFPILMQIIGFIIALLFNTIERNFNPQTIIHTALTHFLDGFIYGSFLLAYHYYKSHKKNQELLANYHKTVSESRIYQLKAQLNPHFLFNNLNVLDQLIDEDKNKASVFLNEFAEIYRYVLQASDREIVPLNEEITFAKQFFRILQHKYENAYQLSIETGGSQAYIVPLTLQLLIENTIQHNLGTTENPIAIKINISDEELSVINNCKAKIHQKPTSGRALNNLKEQYRLLTNKEVKILKHENQFQVIVPLIKMK